jgi:hypothetical protein
MEQPVWFSSIAPALKLKLSLAKSFSSPQVIADLFDIPASSLLVYAQEDNNQTNIKNFDNLQHGEQYVVTCTDEPNQGPEDERLARAKGARIRMIREHYVPKHTYLFQNDIGLEVFDPVFLNLFNRNMEEFTNRESFDVESEETFIFSFKFFTEKFCE